MELVSVSQAHIVVTFTLPGDARNVFGSRGKILQTGEEALVGRRKVRKVKGVKEEEED